MDFKYDSAYKFFITFYQFIFIIAVFRLFENLPFFSEPHFQNEDERKFLQRKQNAAIKQFSPDKRNPFCFQQPESPHLINNLRQIVYNFLEFTDTQLCNSFRYFRHQLVCLKLPLSRYKFD
jgi:hypothetical protein